MSTYNICFHGETRKILLSSVLELCKYVINFVILSRSLQRTLNDLKDYQKKHDYWQQQNDKLLAEQVPMDVKVAQHVAYEELKIKEMSAEIGTCKSRC